MYSQLVILGIKYGIWVLSTWFFVLAYYLCYQFCILRNLRIDIKDRLEEYSQSIEIDIHVCTQSQEKLITPSLRFGYALFLLFKQINLIIIYGNLYQK